MKNINLYLNAKKNKTSWTKKEDLLAAAKRLGFAFIKDVDNYSPPYDYVLNIQPCNIIYGKKWTGLWHIDVFLDSRLYSLYHTFDTIFSASSVGIVPPQTLLFQACDPSFNTSSKKLYDLVFCSSTSPDNLYSKRKAVYSLLEKRYSCLTVAKGQPIKDYIKTISMAKIQLVQPAITKKWGMCAQRFFECLAIGPVLCDYTPDLDLLGLIEGGDYFSYRNKEELLDKMKLLEDDKLRLTMAKRGREKALLWHTYDNRLVSILNIIKW